LGSATLDNSGIATLPPFNTLSPGSHSITAVYSGDPNFSGSASSPLVETVGGSYASVALQTSAATLLVQNNVMFTASVTSTTGGTPTGSVVFMDNNATSLGTAILGANGKASLSISTLPLGSHSITAVYEGDANFWNSTSSALNETVQDFQFVTSLTGSSPVGLSAIVQAGGVANYQLQIVPVNGPTFPSAIGVSVSNLPPGSTCVITPSTISSGSTAQTLAVQVQTSLLARLRNSHPTGMGFALALLPILGTARLRLLRQMLGKGTALLGLLLVIIVWSLGSCGGTPRLPQRNYTMQLNATSGNLAHATTLSLIVK
jgi:hypothetical protein